MFKRRRPRSHVAAFGRALYPRGGWWRAIRYMGYRLRRLPDPAYKISRGIAAGVFVSFTPFFGLHFLLASGLAWIMGGNILAALLATFFGNPLTFPIIAGTSVELGAALLGVENGQPLHETIGAFSRVSIELWSNAKAVFSGAPVRWYRLDDFMGQVFLPYLVGGLIPGVVCAVIAYAASRPVISAYQKSRARALENKLAKRRAAARNMKKDGGNGGT
ncbi:DUF2062 domain-containing protein [Profundibacterium mesophilum]|uniref:DUF2062 domain-containing protein n=1 Tax=Profundibacterium mesophilum KAUST100406-0324 TaxID=1037889 RepID=A0A921TBF7_9RHOB|nr:DUF2062 domain-containing protein [Profundibacterium mesophilum]KAF0675540.1 uncharacterized protein PMES_02171 [Profundibacterium mesophilum KAUST100406-0324]